MPSRIPREGWRHRGSRGFLVLGVRGMPCSGIAHDGDLGAGSAMRQSATVEASKLNVGRKYAARETLATRYETVRATPLVKVQFVGPVRGRNAKVRWLEGERTDLEEWVPNRYLVCRWGERQRFLRDEERLHALKQDVAGLDSVVWEAIEATFEATGESVWFDGVWRASPEGIQRLWARARLSKDPDHADPLREPLAFVDRTGKAHVPWRAALRWAQAFAVAEPETVGLYLTEVEQELDAEGWQSGRRHMHKYLRETKAAHSVVRDWSGQADRDSMRREIERLQGLLHRAIADLNDAGAPTAAHRLRMAFESHG